MRLVDIDLLPRVIIGYGGEFMQGVQYMREMLNLLPAVEVPEVRHGYNVKEDTPSLFECSECGWSDCDTFTGDSVTYNYCPNCGAKMDGGDAE